MWLPTSLLLLASASANAYQFIGTDAYGYHNGVAPNTLDRVINTDEFDRHQTRIDAGRTEYRRQKRATMTFNRAWKVLLKTTVGSKNIYGDYGNGIPTKIKAFAKVGSADEAARDFYSLLPTQVKQVPVGLAGKVGNKGILLHTSEPPYISLNDVYRENKISIRYFETSAQAENRLRKWKELFRMQ